MRSAKDLTRNGMTMIAQIGKTVVEEVVFGEQEGASGLRCVQLKMKNTFIPSTQGPGQTGPGLGSVLPCPSFRPRRIKNTLFSRRHFHNGSRAVGADNSSDEWSKRSLLLEWFVDGES